jgi:hypothetical protein
MGRAPYLSSGKTMSVLLKAGKGRENLPDKIVTRCHNLALSRPIFRAGGGAILPPEQT